MSEAQILDFEKKIVSDQEYSENFSSYKSAQTAITVLSREKLRSNLAKIFHDENRKKPKPKKNSNLKELLTDIFNEFFIPFENILTARADPGKDENLLKAMSMYSKGDYKNASLLFKRLLKKNPGDLVINFYYGISELALENFDGSKKLFKKIILDDKDLLKDLARWYMGLAYLKSGNTKSAKKHFESLTNKSSFFDTQKILQKINSL
ncbi:MAG: tetratricopeptide repeat protein [Bacteroidota bacterium]|nr:tetratricopeptide repeat protein [Bacteroidota bacterium]